LPFGSAVEKPAKKQPATSTRRKVTVNDQREVLWLYRNKPNMSMANIADRTGIPAATVRQWCSRWGGDKPLVNGKADLDRLYLQRPPSDGRLNREQLSQNDLESGGAA